MQVIARDLKKDETAFSFSDIIEMGVENARKEGHLQDSAAMPQLYTDNVPVLPQNQWMSIF